MLRWLLKGDRPYIACLALLNLFFFAQILFTGQTLFYRDIGDYYFPLKKLTTEAYASGQWPLWNPYIQFGQPLLANPNSMALYPTQILFQILPFSWAFDLSLALHCLVGGLGLFYLARKIGCSSGAALVAAIAYNFSGVALSFVNLPILSAIAGLLPWLALTLWKVIRELSAASLLCLSVLIGLTLLLLEPLTCFAALLFLVPFAAYALLTRPAGLSLRKTALALLTALVSGFCLAAAQVFPTLELLQNSGRGFGLNFTKATFWSVNPFSLTQMLFPGVWEDPFSLTNVYVSWSNVFFEGREPYIVSIYCGLVCILFALLGLFFSDKIALKWTLAGAALAALVLALGKYTPIYSVLYTYLPPFRLGRYPAKYMLTVTLSVALLAGLGIDQALGLAQRLKGKTRKRLVGWFVLAGALLLGSGLLTAPWILQKLGARVVAGLIRFPYHGTIVSISQSAIWHSVVYLWLMVLAAAGLVVLVLFRGRSAPRWMLALAATLVFADLYISNHSINPLVESSAYEPSPVAQWLLQRSSQEGMSRVYHLWGATPYQIRGNTNSLGWHFLFTRLAVSPYGAAADHVQYSSLPPIDRLETRASQQVDLEIQRAGGRDERLRFLAGLNTGYVLSMEEMHEPLLMEQLVAVTLNSDKPLRIYRLRNTAPRAYLRDPGAGRGSVGEAAPADAPAVSVTRYAAGELELAVNAAKPGSLVLLDSYYPGWRVWVDGRESQIELANQVFRSVAVPAGRHDVRFEYHPRSFLYGLILTIATIVGWGAGLVIVHYRRPRR